MQWVDLEQVKGAFLLLCASALQDALHHISSSLFKIIIIILEISGSVNFLFSGMMTVRA